MKGSKRSSQPSDLSVPGVDLGQLERLLAFMSEHGLEEFEYAHGDLRIRLKKAVAPAGGVATRALPVAPQSASPETPAAAPPETSVAVPPAAATPGTAAPAAAPAPSEELHVIKSPIVGTFYSAPNPEAEPFVKLGDVVEIGQTVCIIEAMKLMNEIEADVSGEVVRILVENGQPIEYGEHLFALRPTGKKK